ncbi:MAG: PulJ/GspJ family protein [Candidatus Binatia bacterium]
MRRPRLGSAALSAVEVVIVSAVWSVLTLLVHETTRLHGETFRRETARTTTHEELRIWLARLIRDVRQAGYDPTGSGNFGILQFGSGELRFTADVDGDGIVDSGASEHFGYRLEGGVLERWHGDSSWRPVVAGITGLEFRYYDVAGREVTTAATAVSIVEIELSAQASSGGAAYVTPPTVSRRGAAEIRNDLS